MNIDTTSLAKIGDMTFGAGIAGVFDGSLGTTGYQKATTGFAGVTLAAPTRIKKAIAVSAINGFDASGDTSVITLRLMAKQGAAPTGPADGTILATVSFSDVNTQSSRTLESLDQSTLFDHVWVTVISGQWTVLADLTFEDAPAPAPPVVYAVGQNKTILRTRSLTETPLPWKQGELPEFRVAFSIDTARVVSVDLHIEAVHKGISTNGVVWTGVLGIGYRVLCRSGATAAAMQAAPWQAPDSMVAGVNIMDITDHYASLQIKGATQMAAGFHEFTVVGSAHTSGVPDTVNGLAVNQHGYNTMLITVEDPDTVFIDLRA